MPSPIAPLRAFDPDIVLDGVLAALSSTANITNDVPRAQIINGFTVGNVYPRIVVETASIVMESAYGGTTLNTLVDVSIYTKGDSTTMVRRVTKNALTALVDTVWAGAGFTVNDVTLEGGGVGVRTVDDLDGAGQQFRGRAFTMRVWATLT